MRFFHFVLAAGLCLTSAQGFAAAKSWKDFKGDIRDAAIPKDVRRYVIDGQACWHFLGEEPYDKARKKFLDKKIKAHCTPRLDLRGEKLQKKYEGDAIALATVNEIMIAFREPVQP
jgi:hypothetical protein